MDSQFMLVDSNDSSGNSSISCVSNTETLNSPDFPEITALKRLSKNLEFIFESHDFGFFTDATIVVDEDHEVPVHRCILSARSPFFKNWFSTSVDERGGKVQLKELLKDFNVGFDSLVAVLSYLYSGQVRPLPKGVCVCVDEDCSHVACRPAVNFMVEVVYASFTFQISELVALYQRHLLDILGTVEKDDILVILYVAKMCDKACEGLLSKCIEIVVYSNIDIVMLEKSLPSEVVNQIMLLRSELRLAEPESNSFPCKHVKKIHGALDSHDVELVKMLLEEGHTNLDEAYALHYAVAYCNAKTTRELLDLGLANVNRRNQRGYTVLHVAAMRKEPNILGALLTKGARADDLTSDGRKALQISKRLTRAVDYHRFIADGKAAPKDRLCIEVLEQEEKRCPLIGEASASFSMAGKDLSYFEQRVALAKIFFPTEAQVAMDIAQVDLYQAPFKIEEKHLNRMIALSNTVDFGRRFFPRCSAELNKIMDVDNLSELAKLGGDTPEMYLMKKKRYTELHENMLKAFYEDKEEHDRSRGMGSSSSSLGVARPNGRHTTRNK